MSKLKFAAIGLRHAHIYGMCTELIRAGAELVGYFDDDEASCAAFAQHFPAATQARCEQELLANPATALIAGAAVPCERAALGIRVMRAGKDYFTDKGPFTAKQQLSEVRRVIAETGKKYMVCYSERLQSECSEYAGKLIREGAIGRVYQVVGMGPHRLAASSRPDWFFRKSQYGGIIADICSHQFEQFLYFSGESDADVVFARAENFAHPEYPELEDFGEVVLKGKNGTAGYVKVDWFTPDGLASWGDVRTFILGTEGYIELRKNLDITGAKDGGEHLFLTTNASGTQYIDCKGKIGHPFFAAFIDDCLNRTENAMTQEHCLKAAEICLNAQDFADRAHRA